MKSILEETFALHCKANKLNVVREHKFHPTRRWKFDFAFPDAMLAIEAEGGIWSNGRHTRGSGYVADLEKYNQAVLLGWRVLRFDSKSIKTGEAIKLTLQALQTKAS